jgi:ABC-type transport system involved in multi-copper enzyme maturation permease subunit
VPFLPIVERELRVAARQPRTWWRRVLTTGVALVLFGFFFWAVGGFTGLSFVGQYLFAVLVALGTVYVLLAGPFATADCLSRERREGTLGLLFLTDLHSYDVVLGKMAAASLYVVLDLIAALPVAALPLLMGGVSLGQLAVVALALVNIMFLSLAIGTCASAQFSSGRSSLAVTVGALILLTFGVAIVGEGLFGVNMTSPAAPYFYMFSPMYAMSRCLGGVFTTPKWDYWLNLGGMHALGWVCLLAASWRTTNSWRDLPTSARQRRWREWFGRWRQGSAVSRLAWRRFMLDKNPVSWLEGRDRLQERLLWQIILAVAILGAVIHLHAPSEWPDEEWVVGWPILAHYVLCMWIAIQAPRRLADDKESGALELLLCTLITPAEIVRGCMLLLWRRFGRVLLALMAVDAFFACAFFSEHGGWGYFRSSHLLELALYALVVFPVQAYSLARTGLYQGLVQATSLRASFVVIWLAGLLPWLVWGAFLMSWSIALNRFRTLPCITDQFVFGSWAGAYLLVCGLFLAHASWRLRRNFRALAGQADGRPWWKRWGRLRR